jgi:hypothetical protein
MHLSIEATYVIRSSEYSRAIVLVRYIDNRLFEKIT